jgi:enamine deaminase RidA (YjgF/YER057c/UK114 family)
LRKLVPVALFSSQPARVLTWNSGDNMRQNIGSGTIWEQKFGYSRAVRIGNQVFVAGTTAVDEQNNLVGGADLYAQASFIWKKIERALAEAGATLKDVVRIRTFVIDISRWEDAARAQGEVFHDIRPAATLVQVTALVRPDLLVEIEADAVIS